MGKRIIAADIAPCVRPISAAITPVGQIIDVLKKRAGSTARLGWPVTVKIRRTGYPPRTAAA